MDKNELYHYGVQGMKWGIIRTPAQLGHRIKQHRLNKQRKANLKKAREAKAERAEKLKKGKIKPKDMTKAELEKEKLIHETKLMQRRDDKHQRSHKRLRRHRQQTAVGKLLGRRRCHKVGQQRTQTVEREEGNQRHSKHTTPSAAVGLTVGKPLHASRRQSKHKQRRRLAEPSRAPRPSKAKQLSFPEVRLHRLQKSPFSQHLYRSVPILPEVKHQYLPLAIHNRRIHQFHPLHRLRHQHRSHHEQRPRLQSADHRQHESHDTVQHKHLATEKRSVETTKAKEQQHAPAKPQSEVLAPPCRITVHDIEAETKQQGKYCIRLTSNHKPQSVPHHQIYEFQQRRVWVHLVV